MDCVKCYMCLICMRTELFSAHYIKNMYIYRIIFSRTTETRSFIKVTTKNYSDVTKNLSITLGYCCIKTSRHPNFQKNISSLTDFIFWFTAHMCICYMDFCVAFT